MRGVCRRSPRITVSVVQAVLNIWLEPGAAHGVVVVVNNRLLQLVNGRVLAAGEGGAKSMLDKLEPNREFFHCARELGVGTFV